MPTREILEEFWNDFDKLTPEQQQKFIATVAQFVEDLRRGQGFRPGLCVKGVRTARGVFEMAWSGDGRATFQYGISPHPGDVHIIWRRIGGHDILQNP
jgi:hypothetical protein